VYGHDQTRAFCYIDDAVTGTVLAMEQPGTNGQTYHIGTQDEISIGDLIHYAGELMGFTGEYENAPTYPGSVSRRCPDITKARTQLGYEPKIMWKEGLKKRWSGTINILNQENWYMSNEKFIPLSVPNMAGNEWKYVKDCLDTGWISSVGAYVTQFENMVAAFAGAKYGVAAVNGTSALHISLLLSGVKQNDYVILPNLTFVASANSIKYLGAEPILIDADPDMWQMDLDLLEEFLEKETDTAGDSLIYKKDGRRIAAIMPVHILGNMCDMDRFLAIVKKYPLPIVEDATEALGTTYKGISAGNFSPLACFSFNGNKIISTGGWSDCYQ
jgi:hypothetical protein